MERPIPVEEAPRISIIIVNHNGQRFLDALGQSLRRQTYRNHEVLCVDNGSSDDSVTFLRTQFPEVQVIEAENRGYGAGCNRGARAATGTYVMFLNEDYILPKDCLERLARTYERLRREDPEIGALACSQSAYDGTPNAPVYPGVIDLFGFMAPNRRKRTRGAFIPGCPFFTTRALFLKSDGFCEQIFLYGEDIDLSWRFTLIGKRNYSAPEIQVQHYEGGSLSGFPPKKIYYLLHATPIALFNNFAGPTLALFLFLHVLFVLTFVNVGLLVFTRGELRYQIAALRAFADFLRKLPSLIPYRARVQRSRVISDWTFLKQHFTFVPSLLRLRSYRRL